MVEQADAADWTEARLAEPPVEGVARIFFHTIVWQYLPKETKDRITDAPGDRSAQAQPASDVLVSKVLSCASRISAELEAGEAVDVIVDALAIHHRAPHDIGILAVVPDDRFERRCHPVLAPAAQHRRLRCHVVLEERDPTPSRDISDVIDPVDGSQEHPKPHAVVLLEAMPGGNDTHIRMALATSIRGRLK
jgi:hypothetical protein